MENYYEILLIKLLIDYLNDLCMLSFNTNFTYITNTHRNNKENYTNNVQILPFLLLFFHVLIHD